MDDLPDHLLCLIFSHLRCRRELNPVSLVCKRFYELDRIRKTSLRVYYGFPPLDSDLSSLCSRFCNLSTIEIDYRGWETCDAKQINDNGLKIIASRCAGLQEVSLNSCGLITDAGLKDLASCNGLRSVKLSSLSMITERGVRSLVIGCKNLSLFHLICCCHIRSGDWLSCLGCLEKLEDLAFLLCSGMHEGHLVLLEGAWSRLRRFQFQVKVCYPPRSPTDSGYGCHDVGHRLSCDMLEELYLFDCFISPGGALGYILRNCKNLVRLHLNRCKGLRYQDLLCIAKSCSGLKRLFLGCPVTLRRQDSDDFALTEWGLEAIAKHCKFLEELFISCNASPYMDKLFYYVEGIPALATECQTLKTLLLDRLHYLSDSELEALCAACSLERLELSNCPHVSDNGVRLLWQLPALKHLVFSRCDGVSDEGLAAFAFRRSDKLECLEIEKCPRISEVGVAGLAKIVHYSFDLDWCDF